MLHGQLCILKFVNVKLINQNNQFNVIEKIKYYIRNHQISNYQQQIDDILNLMPQQKEKLLLSKLNYPFHRLRWSKIVKDKFPLIVQDFQLIDFRDLVKVVCFYPSFIQLLVNQQLYPSFLEFVRSKGDEIQEQYKDFKHFHQSISKSYILYDLKNNIQSVEPADYLLSHYPNITIQLSQCSPEQLKRVFQFSMMGVKFKIKQTPSLMGNEAYRKCFHEQSMHPFTYFSLNPGMDDYYRDFLSIEQKLYFFGKDVFQELFTNLLNLKRFTVIDEWKSRIPNQIITETFIKWISTNNFNVYDGRTYQHQTQKVKVKRNVFTKRTTLTIEQKFKTVFQDILYNGTIQLNEMKISNFTSDDPQIVAYIIQWIEDSFAGQFSQQGNLSELEQILLTKQDLLQQCEKIEQDKASLEKLVRLIEQYCVSNSIWVPFYNIPTIMYLLPYMNKMNQLAMFTIQLEPVVFILMIIVLSILSRKKEEYKQIASDLWNESVSKLSSEWVLEVVNNKMMFKMLMELIIVRNTDLIMQILNVLYEKQQRSLVEQVFFIVLKNVKEHSILKQLVIYEQEKKILNNSQVRKMYAILLKMQAYDLLKLLVNRVLSKKKNQSPAKQLSNHMLSSLRMQFFQAQNIHWSICFDEELFESTLISNFREIAAKANRIRFFFYNLVENGLANKLKLALQIFEQYEIWQLVLECLVIVQKHGFMQMYFEQNESWFKFYQGSCLEQNEEKNEVYNFLGSYRSLYSEQNTRRYLVNNTQYIQEKTKSANTQSYDDLSTKAKQLIQKRNYSLNQVDVKHPIIMEVQKIDYPFSIEDKQKEILSEIEEIQNQQQKIIDENIKFKQKSRQLENIERKVNQKHNQSSFMNNSAIFAQNAKNQNTIMRIGLQDYLLTEHILFEKLKQLGITNFADYEVHIGQHIYLQIGNVYLLYSIPYNLSE